MEEADQNCERIGKIIYSNAETWVAIIVKGSLQCIGSSQHLKSRFADGYLLVFSYKNESLSAIKEFIQKIFPQGNILENYGNIMKVNAGHIDSLSDTFEVLERQKDELGRHSLKALLNIRNN